jgi:hypothetical protein
VAGRPGEHREVKLVLSVSQDVSEGGITEIGCCEIIRRDSEVSGCAVTKDSYTHLTCSITELLFIRDICDGIYTKDTIAVSISSDISIKTAREDSIAGIITVSSSPVVATKRTNVRKEIAILIKYWLVITDVANVRNPIAHIKLIVLKVVLSLCLSNMLFKLNFAHAGT